MWRWLDNLEDYLLNDYRGNKGHKCLLQKYYSDVLMALVVGGKITPDRMKNMIENFNERFE